MNPLFKKRFITPKESDTPSTIVSFTRGYLHYDNGVFTLSFLNKEGLIFNADELEELAKVILTSLAASDVDMTEIRESITEFFNGGGQ
ncbi:MAG: hypothetical protein RBR26_05485 [Methanosarcina mazei]|nr:hypothetical protein [Methanosarcina mazei]